MQKFRWGDYSVEPGTEYRYRVIACYGRWDARVLACGPSFSPQSNDDMLRLYAALCEQASHLMVCAPFTLAQPLRDALADEDAWPLRYLLVDKEGSLGKPEEVRLIKGDPSNALGVAVTLKSPLHDFQQRLLLSPERFLHSGIHIHSKLIAVNPLGDDPILITGSANYSNNSTRRNDENSIIIRGDLAVADIYATEFMRMFEHYHFRGSSRRRTPNAPRPGRGPWPGRSP